MRRLTLRRRALVVGTALMTTMLLALVRRDERAVSRTVAAMRRGVKIGSAEDDAPSSAVAQGSQGDAGSWPATEVTLALDSDSSPMAQAQDVKHATKVASPVTWQDMNAPPLPANVDWLHVPKTGTSFQLSILLYKCDQELSEESGGDRAKEVKLLETLSSATRKGKTRKPCVRGVRYYHHSLYGATHLGHRRTPDGTPTVGDVVTVLRRPISRIASGFVHELHDCSFIPHRPVVDTCKALAGPAGPNKEAAKQLVLSYAKCVAGCAGRMITGHPCAHHGAPTTNNLTRSVQRATYKIQRFGFVGLTDRWEESMCLFRKHFQRKSGNPYPVGETNKNVRPTHSMSCSHYVKDVLNEAGFVDPLDDAVYEVARERFEADLAHHPECASAT